MCYFLYIASPLTLSEVRSMLPPGATADLAASGDQRALKALHPDAQTVTRILVGQCSCDLVRPRLTAPIEDERHLRERYRRLGVPRAAVITALERHRRGAGSRTPGGGWPRTVTKFVSEHARNAGPTIYLLQFTLEAVLAPPGDVRRLALAEVVADPEGWLAEGTPTLVAR